MKLEFADKSYIQIKKSDESGKILLIISAKDGENPLKKITNCVEISEKDFKFLISDMV